MSTLVRFGPERRLVGVLSGSERPTSPITLVLPSAGLLPRTGPFRLHVDLSHRLGKRGIQTFRFDVPGVGEAPRINGCDASSATMAAIDHLASHHGCKLFAVGGLCSAADLGWSAAVHDQRVIAMLMLDGISFHGPWFHLAHFRRVVQRIPDEGWGMLRRFTERVTSGERRLTAIDYRDWPTHSEARDQFSGLVDRGVHSLWIYTGTYSERFLHPRQFSWSFGAAARDPKTVLHHWEDCDHLFYARAHRQRLIETVDSWLDSILKSEGLTP